MTDFNKIYKLFNTNNQCGYAEDELGFWKRKYGCIPKVLKDYYLQLGRHEDLNTAQDFLIPPSQFEEYKDDNYLIFYSENQGGIIWGIKKQDLCTDNPPVYENYGQDEWTLTTDSVYKFLLSMAHLQAVLSLEYSNEEYVDITPEQATKIADRFTSKNVDSDLYTGVKFYGNYEDTVIVIMNNHEAFILMYASSDEEHFNETDDIINNILDE